MADYNFFGETFLAPADYSAYQYHAVKQGSTAGDMLLADSNAFLGILQDAPNADGKSGFVAMIGKCKVKLGGTVAAGDRLIIDSSGHAIKSTTGLGRITALAAGSANDVASVWLNGPGLVPARYSFSIPCASLANGDQVTTLTLPSEGYVTGFRAITTQVTTDADGAATLNLEIGTTNLIGGTIALSNADLKVLGRVEECAAITAGADFDAGATISVEASSVTACSDGVIEIQIDVALYN